MRSRQVEWSGGMRGVYAFESSVRLSVVVVLAVIPACAAFCPGELAAAAPETGLRGILPARVPYDMIEDEFAVLDGNWADWSQKLAADVNRLYEDENLDVAAQKQLIATLRSKLNVMERALADSRYRSIHEELNGLHGRLERRVDMAEAILESLELKPEAVRASRVESAGRDLLRALDRLESAMASIRGGSAWLDYVRHDELRQVVQGSGYSTEALESVQKRLRQNEDLQDARQRAFLSRPEFVALARPIDRLLAALQGELPEGNPDGLRPQLASLIGALENYEAEKLDQDAARVHQIAEALGSLAADEGERIRHALRSSYLSSNFQVVASEPFLSRLLYSQQSEYGPVRDYILGANVSGQQRTTSVVGVDVKPSSTAARFDITLSGTVRSNTAGVTDQATIYTDGYHQFSAAKEVLFDGHVFQSSPPRISVDANNRTTGARTGISGFPIFGSIAEGVAVREARRKQFQSEAIARQRVSDRVLPKFDQEAVDKLFDLNERLQMHLDHRLRECEIYPVRRVPRSTDSDAWLSSTVHAENELAGSPLSAAADPADGIVFQIHESLLNNMFDRMSFVGRTMSDDEIREELERYFSLLTGDEVSFADEAGTPSDPESSASSLIFADSDPIRFQIAEGAVNLVLRAGIKQPDRDDIPTQVVTVPVTFSLDGSSLRLVRGGVRVAPAPGSEGGGRQIIRAGVMRKKIQDSLPDRERSRTIHFQRPGEEDLALNIGRIDARNGWLTVWAK